MMHVHVQDVSQPLASTLDLVTFDGFLGLTEFCSLLSFVQAHYSPITMLHYGSRHWNQSVF